MPTPCTIWWCWALFVDQNRLFAGWLWLLVTSEFFEHREVNNRHTSGVGGIELDL
jgi:hypothetical protein